MRGLAYRFDVRRDEMTDDAITLSVKNRVDEHMRLHLFSCTLERQIAIFIRDVVDTTSRYATMCSPRSLASSSAP